MLWTFVFAALFLSLAMALAWLVQRRTGSSGWIDAIWSAAVGAGGMAMAASLYGHGHPRALISAVLAGLWAARLAGYIVARTRGAAEDPRYADLARQWGADFPSRLFWFLQIQAAAGLVLVAGVTFAAANPAPFPAWTDLLALLVMTVALVGEAVADEQMAAFRRGSQGRKAICRRGLWAWSRHPNYFFEWLGWCAYPLLGLNFSGLYPLGFLTLAAPALIYVLLVHVSGAPPLEAYLEATRGKAFAGWKAEVSVFFPMPPGKKRPQPERIA